MAAAAVSVELLPVAVLVLGAADEAADDLPRCVHRLVLVRICANQPQPSAQPLRTLCGAHTARTDGGVKIEAEVDFGVGGGGVL